MSPWDLKVKIRRKGLLGSLRLLCARYLYDQRRLLWLERDLALEPPRLQRQHHWSYPPISRELLPAFERYFPQHRTVIDDLLEQEGVQGLAALDGEGNVCAFLWYSDRDYYDRHYYRCWFPVTAPSVYLFAVEVAPGHRGSALMLGGQERLWELLHAAGHQRARAVVDARNARARKLLEHLGFQPLGWQTRVFTLFGCLRFSHQPPAVRDQLGRQSGSLSWYRIHQPFRRFP
ncbi:GNAT family N-acetyltransferase [Azotobacter armeniacus]